MDMKTNIINAYCSGNSYRIIQECLRVSSATILKALREANVDTKSRQHQCKVGDSVKQEIINLFGKPDNIIRRHSDRVTLYLYKSITSISVGAPIPLISLGKVKTVGYQVNIIFSDDTDMVIGVESSEFKETFF